MRIVLQRVKKADVKIAGEVYASIDLGLVLFVGIETEDTQNDIDWLVKKIIGLRIFRDAEQKMNLSIKDVNGSILLISQFTLFASTKKGNRPSFIKSANPKTALPLYENLIEKLNQEYPFLKTGVFGADMEVSLINDGPVTLLIDTKNKE